MLKTLLAATAFLSLTAGALVAQTITPDEALRDAARAAWEPTGTAEENKAVVRQALEVVMRDHQLDRAGEFYGEPYLQNNPNIPDGVEAMRGYFAPMFAAFPDYAPTIDLIVAGDDLVSVHLTWRGTHTGAPYEGVQPTGAEVIVRTADVFRVRGGKIVEHWDVVDRTGMMLPLGLMEVRAPAPQAAH